tara:strand:+ start:443 stop:1195 length:753 start_codon:yes stop_codon:yes gene_type:complete
MNNSIIVANWKMNPSTLEEAIQLTKNIVNLPLKNKIILLVPFPFIYCVNEEIKKQKNTNLIELGSQDCYIKLSGAYTSAISIPMIKTVGCSYVLTGHSERRLLFNDTNSLINKKIHLILESNLKCILCIGENKLEYEQGLNKETCSKQLKECLRECSESDLSKIIIAYEPVWAIGTGLNATPEIAEEIHCHIRDWLSINYSNSVAKNMTILYGGSVNSDNVSSLLKMNNINGALVGGASLDINKFSKIVK